MLLKNNINYNNIILSKDLLRINYDNNILLKSNADCNNIILLKDNINYNNILLFKIHCVNNYQ